MNYLIVLNLDLSKFKTNLGTPGTSIETLNEKIS